MQEKANQNGLEERSGQHPPPEVHKAAGSHAMLGAVGGRSRDAQSSVGTPRYTKPSDPLVTLRTAAWLRAFAVRDPRQVLLKFFRPGDERGPFGHLQSQGLRPTGRQGPELGL